MIELVLALLAVAAGIALLARRVGVPYPLLLVLGGLVLALVPGLPRVDLEPDVVFLVFLPPLVFFPAVTTSLRDFRQQARAIGLLSVGLVLFTTVVVAVVARLVVPGMPWAVAFALGAIVSPPDAVAATTIARRLNLPRRIVVILEGESLLNDASALVAYRVAVGAIGAGAFSVLGAGATFAVGVLGGLAVGAGCGLALEWSSARLTPDADIDNTIFLLLPYAAYLAAEAIHGSGVVAVVTAGIIVGRRVGIQVAPGSRQQGYAVMDQVSFVLNLLVFILIGLQLRGVLERAADASAGPLVLQCAVVSAAVIAARVVWLFPATYLPRLLSRRIRAVDPPPPAGNVVVVAWAGMRGVVSLAAALALPPHFPQRDVVLALTFAVILVTLVVQGLTLPVLIRRLGLHDDGKQEREEVDGRAEVARAALRRLDEVRTEPWVRDDTAQRIEGLYTYRRSRWEARQDGANGSLEERSTDYQRLMHDLLQAQRDQVVQLRDTGRIDDEVLRRIQRDLDLEELRLEQ